MEMERSLKRGVLLDGASCDLTGLGEKRKFWWVAEVRGPITNLESSRNLSRKMVPLKEIMNSRRMHEFRE